MAFLEIGSMPPVFLCMFCTSGLFLRWHHCAICTKMQASPWPGMEILLIFSFWDHLCSGTVPLCSHATFGKCISTEKLM